MLAFSGPVAGCGGDESPAGETAGGGPPTGESVDAGERPSEVTLDELVENPQLYYDEQVTVSGEVAQVYASPGAFTLGASVSEEDEGVRPDSALLEGEEGQGPLLVLPLRGASVPAAEITEGDLVRVQGIVCEITNVRRLSEDGDFLYEAQRPEFVDVFPDANDRPGIYATVVDARTGQRGGGGRQASRKPTCAARELTGQGSRRQTVP